MDAEITKKFRKRQGCHLEKKKMKQNQGRFSLVTAFLQM